jgi:hypothetical protein
MNWFPVEYEGTLRWDDHMVFNDNDWTWNIRRDDLALGTQASDNVHLEHDSGETVNDFDGTNTWWDDFHHNWVDQKDKTTLQNFFGTKSAIVIGMLGLDLIHDAHTELHPVYAMFIRLPEQTTVTGTRETVRWTFFVRNWGNEGFCGGNQEPIPNTQIRVRIPDQTLLPSPNVFVFAHDTNVASADECASQSQMTVQSSAVDTLLTFDLPPASKRCGIVGDLNMAGSTLVVGGGGGILEPTREDDEDDEGDPALTARIAALDPSARQQLREQLSIVMTESKSGPTVRRMGLVIRTQPANTERAPFTPILPNYGKGLKAAPNPGYGAQQEKRRRFIDAFLKARGIN